jgi:copper chaperone
MRKTLAVLAVAALGLVPGARAGDSAKTTLAIKGMTCGGCVGAVKIQLKKTEGVSAYEVSLEKAEAQVTYDPAKTEPKKIAESVSKTGFEASVKQPAESKKAK